MDKLKQHIQNNLQKLDIDQPKEDLWNAISGEIHRVDNPDQLKEHIGQYAGELDVETPEEHSWSKIRSEISADKPVQHINYKKLGWYVAAASLVLFIIVGALLYKNSSAPNKGEDLAATPSKTEVTVPKVLPPDTMKEVAKGPLTPDNNNQLEQKSKELAQIDKKEYIRSMKKSPSGQHLVNRTIPQEIVDAQSEYDNLIAGQVSQIQSMPLYGESAGDFAGFIDDFKRLDQHEKKLRSAVLKKGMAQNTLDELAMIYQKKLTVLKMLQREISRADSRPVNETDTIPVFIKLKKEL